MNVCQLETRKKDSGVTILSLASRAFSVITCSSFEVPVSQIKTVKIRAIAPEKWSYITENPLT